MRESLLIGIGCTATVFCGALAQGNYTAAGVAASVFMLLVLILD